MRITSNEQVEELLASALERCTPDIWGRLCASPAPAGALDMPGRPVGKTRRHALRRAVACVCACLTLFLCAGAFTFFHAAAVIGIDVNPSLEIRVNRFDRVLAVEARNDDARAILGDMNLRYMELDTAINALVGSMVRQGYLAEDGAVLVSVTGGSGQRNVRLQQTVVRDIQSSLEEAGGSGTVYTEQPSQSPQEPPAVQAPPVSKQPPAEQEPAPPANQPAAQAVKPAPSEPAGNNAAKRAEKNGISEAKQRIIDRIRQKAPSLGEKDLAALSVEDLIDLAEDYGADLTGLIQKHDDDHDDEDDEDDQDDDREDEQEAQRPQKPKKDRSYDNDDDDGEHGRDDDSDDEDEEPDDEDD